MYKAVAFIQSLLLLSTITSAQSITQTFGSGANVFSIDFVEIGNPGNPANTTSSPNPVGSVPYIYNLGKYEISRDIVTKANALGGLGITLQDMTNYGGNSASRPATGISWNEAAKFVNWLNTSKGFQAAYQFSTDGSSIVLWESGKYSGNNQFRNKNAYYFLPSIDEWFKGAYVNRINGYSAYATGSDSVPVAVSGSTSANTTVFNQNEFSGPADVNNAGGLSFYGTMGQGGNASEILETANDGANNSPNENRMKRGGSWYFNNFLASNVTGEFFTSPSAEWIDQGFRVASVPEPSAVSLLAVGLGGLALVRRRRA